MSIHHALFYIEDLALNKTDKNPCTHKAYILVMIVNVENKLINYIEYNAKERNEPEKKKKEREQRQQFYIWWLRAASLRKNTLNKD